MRFLWCLLAVSLWCGVAHADPAAKEATVHFTDEPLSLNVVVGLGSPEGEFGGALEYSFTDRFAAGVGAGYGFKGTQYGVSARFRLALSETSHLAQAFDLVGALSTGHADTAAPLSECGDAGCWEFRAYWAQVGLDYELQAGHFRFATGIGAAVTVARSDVEEDVSDSTPPPLSGPAAILTTHVTLGFAF